jgi:hypothetical protein
MKHIKEYKSFSDQTPNIIAGEGPKGWVDNDDDFWKKKIENSKPYSTDIDNLFNGIADKIDNGDISDLDSDSMYSQFDEIITKAEKEGFEDLDFLYDYADSAVDELSGQLNAIAWRKHFAENGYPKVTDDIDDNEDEDIRDVRELRDEGLSLEEIAIEMNLEVDKVHKILNSLKKSNGLKEGWAFSDDIKAKMKREEPEWFSWYDWSNMTEEYMCYDGESKRSQIRGVKGESIKPWILESKFTEEDWEIVGNLEVVESCRIGSVIITRVK